MRNIEHTRKYEVLDTKTTTWVPVHWEQIEEGDIVRSCPLNTLDGPMTEEYVVAQLPALMVDVVKGQGQRPNMTYSTVEGDTLVLLADRHTVSVHFIRYTNWLRYEEDTAIPPGTELQLPIVQEKQKSAQELRVERLVVAAQALINNPHADECLPGSDLWAKLKKAVDEVSNSA